MDKKKLSLLLKIPKPVDAKCNSNSALLQWLFQEWKYIKDILSITIDKRYDAEIVVRQTYLYYVAKIVFTFCKYTLQFNWNKNVVKPLFLSESFYCHRLLVLTRKYLYACQEKLDKISPKSPIKQLTYIKPQTLPF